MIRRRIGVNPGIEGQVDVVLWAPLAGSEALETARGKNIPLEKEGYGYWRISTNAIQSEESYLFVLDVDKKLADPASLSQPEGVHGPSQFINLADHQWKDDAWRNPSLGEHIIYELHTGNFSPQGNFEDIIQK